MGCHQKCWKHKLCEFTYRKRKFSRYFLCFYTSLQEVCRILCTHSNCGKRQERAGHMFHITSNNFQKHVLENPRPVVVMFYASWCSKCAMMKPIAEEMERYFRKNVEFFEIDYEKSSSLSEQYQIDIVPTFLCFQNGTCIGIFQGLMNETTFSKRLQKIF